MIVVARNPRRPNTMKAASLEKQPIEAVDQAIKHLYCAARLLRGDDAAAALIEIGFAAECAGRVK